MPSPFTTIGPLTTPTYTLLLAVGIGVAIALTVFARWLHGERAGAVADTLIAGVIGGVFLARAFHVALHWDYFTLHREEIRFITAGGLDWHGAVIGALAGMAIMARLRRVDLGGLLHTLALVLPLVAFMAWWGCGANHCAYGAEVDNLSNYPAWLVWERHDIYNIIVPRYAVQPLGMMFSAGLLVIVWLLRPYMKRARWPLVLALLAAGMFALGFLRGDQIMTWLGLRLDQWFDLLILVFSLVVSVVTMIRTEIQSKEPSY